MPDERAPDLLMEARAKNPRCRDCWRSINADQWYCPACLKWRNGEISTYLWKALVGIGEGRNATLPVQVEKPVKPLAVPEDVFGVDEVDP